MEEIKKAIRAIPDFPKKGIIFRDITPVVLDGRLLQMTVEALAAHYLHRGIELIAGIESRGFIFGAALAYKMGLGFAVIRKKGKLPWKVDQVTYQLEYGTDILEMHQGTIRKGQRVLIVDDLLATGGTAAATRELIRKQGGIVDSFAFVVELTALNGRKHLLEEVFALVSF